MTADDIDRITSDPRWVAAMREADAAEDAYLMAVDAGAHWAWAAERSGWRLDLPAVTAADIRARRRRP